MCGLVGYIGKPVGEHEEDVLTQMLLNAGSRGKDGWGYMAYQPGKGAHVFKDASSVDKADLAGRFTPRGATVVFGHTRAATSGEDDNPRDCHPLSVGSIVVVHNGIVGNHKQIRKQLDLPADSPQVDSYLIPWIISKAETIEKGIQKVFETSTGSLTFLVWSMKSPATVWAVSNIASNLYHFRYRGRDFFASSGEIFRNAVATLDKWGVSYPAFKQSYHLHGVYQFTPQTLKQVACKEDVEKWERARWDIREVRKLGYKIEDYRSSAPLLPKALGAASTIIGTTTTGGPMSQELLTKVNQVLGMARGNGVPATDKDCARACAAISGLLQRQDLSKKARKKLSKKYANLSVRLYGYGADHEYLLLPQGHGKDCSTCSSSAVLTYHEMLLCWGCLQAFLD